MTPALPSHPPAPDSDAHSASDKMFVIYEKFRNEETKNKQKKERKKREGSVAFSSAKKKK